MTIEFLLRSVLLVTLVEYTEYASGGSLHWLGFPSGKETKDHLWLLFFLVIVMLATSHSICDQGI
jgi:hypothetical protein